MTAESAVWFVGQLLAVPVAAVLGWKVSGGSSRSWRLAASGATALMLAWPLMRMFPSHIIRWFGAGLVIFIEVTGIVIPAVFLFVIAARRGRTPGQRRVVSLLIPICCMYFLRNGLWMVRPPLADLGPMQMDGSICRQSTGYTCVAASLVTLLRAYGHKVSETQMARLTYTEEGWGTTDTRAAKALQDVLGDEPIDVCYETMDYERLKAVPKPCVVPVKWSYFFSHMVPVLAANEDYVCLGDPLNGIMEQPVQEFTDAWQKRGIYLVDRRGQAREAP